MKGRPRLAQGNALCGLDAGYERDTNGIRIWDTDMGYGYGIRIWDTDMGYGYGIRIWDTDMGYGYGIRKWDTEMG